jgi:hypothetical protein
MASNSSPPQDDAFSPPHIHPLFRVKEQFPGLFRLHKSGRTDLPDLRRAQPLFQEVSKEPLHGYSLFSSDARYSNVAFRAQRQSFRTGKIVYDSLQGWDIVEFSVMSALLCCAVAGGSADPARAACSRWR